MPDPVQFPLPIVRTEFDFKVRTLITAENERPVGNHSDTAYTVHITAESRDGPAEMGTKYAKKVR